MISFSFDGKTYRGRPGDTLAAALLANGVRLMGRSFKYHRPRGLLAAGSEEPNALVEIDRGAGRRTPNLRATQVELYEGLVARSQNRFPSLAWDVQAVGELAAPILGAGFYYKTFLGPHGAWSRLYEPLIRRAAGLGRAPDAPDPDHYAGRYAHCDVLVVGSGPAGLAAAMTAAATGARIILCDEQPRFGGSLLAERIATIDGLPAADWLARQVAALAAPNVTLLSRTTAFGWYPDNLIGLVERVTDHLEDPDPALPRERLWQVRAREVVLATGAIERPLVFPGNDRPGVMLADAARTYAVRYGALPARRAVVATSSDTAYRAALDLQASGVEVALIADARPSVDPAWAERAIAAGIRVETGMQVVGTRGRRGLRVVILGKDGRREWVRAGLLAMSGGWTPVLNLFSQSRGKLRWDEAAQTFLPGASAAPERSAGACRGVSALADVLADGIRAGIDAAQAAGHDSATVPSIAAEAPAAAWSPPPLPAKHARKAFVDFQNDVTSKDLRLAAQEGFRAIEHVKRYTTTGMATDQGKTSNLNALAIVADATGAPIPKVGLTTFRPPYTPVTFGALAGHSRGALFDPVRTTPLHQREVAAGAVFEDVGLWKRARFYPRGAESMVDAVLRECLATRRTAGLFDATTLGKIEVAGPDAATFLDRIYANAMGKLEPGRCRYGLMLGEGGFVMDDGIAARLSPTRFHLTTTTGGAPRVLAMMEDYLQTEWPDLRVWLASVTEQWAVLAVQGPAARDVIAPLIESIDLDPAAMPHMSVRTGRVCGVPARLFRVSFTGELGYEINVPAGDAEAVWDAVAARVAAAGGCLYGTETMHVLRAEAGYVIVGQETDGTVTADDLGLGRMVSIKKPDFVGRRSLRREDLARPGRKQLVGLLTGADPLDEGAQIVEGPGARTSLGHVTSAYAATTLGHPIALALLDDGRARIGQTLTVPVFAGTRLVPIQARVVAPSFLATERTSLNA